MQKQSKNKRLGKPLQLYVDDTLKADFGRLVMEYDPMLSVASALRKLMIQAVSENWLPGYIRRDRNITNPLARAIEPKPLTESRKSVKINKEEI